MQIDWTELGDDAPERITGQKALRIPDESKPRYRLSWPWQHGWLNESDYSNRRALMQDFCLIIEDAITDQLGISRKQDLAQYSCVFVIPDLYEKVVVSAVLNELLRDFGFNRVAFIQESLAATFGAGYSISCVVDVGAQKTSIACVEEGLCLENTRMNLKVGGEDVTQTFIKMMLFDHFNYAEMNLRKRHDYLLAEELKHRFCTLSDENITVQQYDFFLRVAGQDTRKYQFKIYDEGMLAPLVIQSPKSFCDTPTDHTPRASSATTSSTTRTSLSTVAVSSTDHGTRTTAARTTPSPQSRSKPSSTQKTTSHQQCPQRPKQPNHSSLRPRNAQSNTATHSQPLTTKPLPTATAHQPSAPQCPTKTGPQHRNPTPTQRCC